MSKIVDVKNQALVKIKDASNLKQLEEIRVEFLSKKGLVQSLMQEIKNVSVEEKPLFGAKVNQLKDTITKALDDKKTIFENLELDKKLKDSKIDIYLDMYKPSVANLHPLTQIVHILEDAFIGLGYKSIVGPEVELDLYNFKRANIPDNHPARDMQDTFYIDPTTLLRTHTTSIQMRQLESQSKNMPIKIICPGKVYRRDDDDATHSHQFYQCEGLVVGENVTLADLKGTLIYMLQSLFSKDVNIRFRPSYFPFTEPSYEVDMSCHICKGKGCSTCKQTGWIEILGCGMVHPNVLEMANIDSKHYTGFAFGVGIERVAMLKYGIKDIRDLYTNDIRFLKSFNIEQIGE